MEEKLVIKPNRIRMFLLCLGSALFSVVGIDMVLHPKPFYNISIGYSPLPMTFLLGLFFVLFFGGGTLFFLYKLLTNAPSLTISKIEINDTSSPFAVGKISKSNLKSITQTGNWLVFTVHDDKPILAVLPLWKLLSLKSFRYLAQFFFRQSYVNQFFIESSYLKDDVKYTAQQINQYL